MEDAPHVFLIEDNAGDVLLFRQILDDQGIPAHVHVARDGDQAIFMLTEHRFEPDLIVLDLNLPRLSGTSFLEQAKPAAPVVVFSSSTSPAVARNCMDLGAKEFIAKPSDFGEYAERVFRIVHNWLPADQPLKKLSRVETPAIARSRPKAIGIWMGPNRMAAKSLASFFWNNAAGLRSDLRQLTACRSVDQFFHDHPKRGLWNVEMRELVDEELLKLKSENQ